MKLINIFKKNKKNKKNYSQSSQALPSGPQATLSPVTREAFVDYLLGRGSYDLANYTLLKYYESCAPVADAADRIAKEIAKINPVVSNTSTGEMIFDHPVLQLLKAPNPVDTYNSLIERLVIFYLITGDTFFLSTGEIRRPPLEIFVASTAAVNINEASDGFVGDYTIQQNNGSKSYLRNETDGKFRYYTKDNIHELFQMKRFRSRGTFTPLHGISVLHSIYYEIEQYIHAGEHNLSLLLRGGSMSGIVTTKDDLMLTDDQRERIRQELSNFVAGSSNAGRTGFFDLPIDYKQLSTSNKDMDFLALKKETKKVIYDRFNIPAPFYSDEVMTMANRETARLDFYDDAILPLLDRIFEELTLFLMYRYPDSDNLVITYDVSNIEALEPRKLDQLTKLNKLNILSINEQRLQVGQENIDGGDDVLVPANFVPIGSSSTQDDGLSKSLATRSEFINLMRGQVTSDGSRRHTDTEIEEIADREGLI